MTYQKVEKFQKRKDRLIRLFEQGKELTLPDITKLFNISLMAARGLITTLSCEIAIYEPRTRKTGKQGKSQPVYKLLEDEHRPNG